MASQETLKGELLRQAKALVQAESAIKHRENQYDALQAQYEHLKAENQAQRKQHDQQMATWQQRFADQKAEPAEEWNFHKQQHQALFQLCETIPIHQAQYTESAAQAILQKLQELVDAVFKYAAKQL